MLTELELKQLRDLWKHREEGLVPGSAASVIPMLLDHIAALESILRDMQDDSLAYKKGGDAMLKRVYLAGPIAGSSYEGATPWRAYVAERMDYRIRVLDPMRGKEHLSVQDRLPTRYDPHPLTTDRAIVWRDYLDVQSASIVLLNLGTASTIGIGSMVEVGWASALGIPIVCVFPEANGLYDHPYIRELTLPAYSLDQAIALVESFLLADRMPVFYRSPKGQEKQA